MFDCIVLVVPTGEKCLGTLAGGTALVERGNGGGREPLEVWVTGYGGEVGCLLALAVHRVAVEQHLRDWDCSCFWAHADWLCWQVGVLLVMRSWVGGFCLGQWFIKGRTRWRVIFWFLSDRTIWLNSRHAVCWSKKLYTLILCPMICERDIHSNIFCEPTCLGTTLSKSLEVQS